MALAAEEYAALAEEMGVAGTAAANLTDILDRLSQAQRAETAAAKAAEAAGVTVAQLRAAQAAATRAAAEEKRNLAAIEKAAAAQEAADARERAADERAARREAAADAREARREAAAAARSDAAAAREAARDKITAAKEAAREAIAVAKQAEQAQKEAAKADVAAFKDRQARATQERDWAKQRAADQLAGKAPDQIRDRMAALQAQVKTGDDALLGFTTQLQGIAQEAAPAIAAVTALAAGVGALAHEAIGATQAKDAIRAMIGPDVLEAVERMSQRLPFTADQLSEMAKGLSIAGYSGALLEGRLEAVAASAAKMRDGGGAAQYLFERLKGMADVGEKVELSDRFLRMVRAAGLSVDDVAKALGVTSDKLKTMSLDAGTFGDAIQRALIAKGAGALSVMGSSLDVIKGKILEGIGDSFDELGDLVHPFMEQVQSLASEIFKGSAGSQILAGKVHDLLAPAFEIGTRTVRAMHIAVLEVEIAYLKASIALRPLTSALEKIGISGGIVNVAMYLIAGTAITLAVVFGVLALAVTLCALPFIVAGVAIYLLVSAIQYVIGVIGGAIDHFDQLKATIINWVVDAVSSLLGLGTGAQQAASDFIQGLVDGITSGGDLVTSAVSALASAALSSFTGPLKIKSPSKVLYDHGKDDMAGAVAGGVDDGADQVDDAMGSLVTVPKGGKGKGRAGTGVYIESLVVNFTGSADDFPAFREQFDAYIEELRAEGPSPEAS